ncbi:hypothetical protein BA190_09565 [Labrys sp. WJW]|nr:hypothetical protein BA190_09565 [Labrys sp. WJW]
MEVGAAPVAPALTGNQYGDHESREGLLVAEPITLAVRGRGDVRQLEFRQDGTANTIVTPNGGRDGIGVGAIAFSSKDHGADATEEVSPTLRAGGHVTSHANSGAPPAIAFNARQDPTSDLEISGALDGDGYTAGVLTHWRVRRLMPVECERLQGFPDGYTLIPVGKKMAADGPRYQALGLSMSTNVMQWIGRRIDMVRSIIEGANS